MSNEPFVIEVTNLRHKYGRTEAVNDLSLQVRRGQCYGFFGRNGAGKTTTIKCLLNLLRPMSGTVRVFGLDPRRRQPSRSVRLPVIPLSLSQERYPQRQHRVRAGFRLVVVP